MRRFLPFLQWLPSYKKDWFSKDLVAGLTVGIILIGEIGGNMEADAAHWIKEHGTKPVVGFIAGQTAPEGRQMGHAGAIVGGKDDTAAAKMEIMRGCGIHVVESPAFIGETMVKALKEAGVEA